MGSGSTRTVLGGDSLPDCHVSSESWLVAVATVDSGAWARGMASPLGSRAQGSRYMSVTGRPAEMPPHRTPSNSSPAFDDVDGLLLVTSG